MNTKPAPACHRQKGAALMVGLIMLVLITIMVTSAFKLSTSNLLSVGNMQTRDEAVAAGNRAIELLMSSAFTNAPAAQTINVDIDNDGTMDFAVAFEKPACVSASRIAVSAAAPSSLSLGSAFGVTGSTNYETVWDLKADVAPFEAGTAASGVAVHVHQGVRILLSEVQYNAACTV